VDFAKANGPIISKKDLEDINCSLFRKITGFFKLARTLHLKGRD
jgi:hypothetical protein